MKRLILAATLAVGVHVALFSMQPQRTPPVLLIPQSRNVTITMVQAPPAPPQKPAPSEIKPPKPKTAARPKPKPKQAPMPVKAPEPAPEPTPAPEIQASNVAPEPLHEDLPPADILPSTPPGQKEGAIIQSSAPRYDINPVPVYPPMAKRRGYEGTVILEVLVTRKGRAGQVAVVESSGYAILDRRAVETVQKWLFRPALRGEEPMDMTVSVPITFELK